MTIESGVTYISDLDENYPAEGELHTLHEGNDHIRNIKLALKQTFPAISAAVSLSATAINALMRKDVTATAAADLHCLADIKIGRVAYFDAELAAGTCTVSAGIDWDAGNKYRVILAGAAVDVKFSAPPGVTNLTLVIEQDGAGSRAASWPAAVKWPGGLAPTLSTTANAIDIASFYYDGSSYFGQYSVGFG
jgi:hypothetical protein